MSVELRLEAEEGVQSASSAVTGRALRLAHTAPNQLTLAAFVHSTVRDSFFVLSPSHNDRTGVWLSFRLPEWNFVQEWPISS